MPDIATHLMFQDGSAHEAVARYVKLIPNSRIVDESGDGGTGYVARFTLGGRPFIAFDSPPIHAFGFTPSMSIFVTCESREEVDTIFAELSDGGDIKMPLDSYDFSPYFGWCTDLHGVSWQVGVGEPWA